MTEEDRIQQAAKDAFKALQAKARREHGGNTQPLLVVYAVESFLRRLAMSKHAESEQCLSFHANLRAMQERIRRQ